MLGQRVEVQFLMLRSCQFEISIAMLVFECSCGLELISTTSFWCLGLVSGLFLDLCCSQLLLDTYTAYCLAIKNFKDTLISTFSPVTANSLSLQCVQWMHKDTVYCLCWSWFRAWQILFSFDLISAQFWTKFWKWV